jgi:hypothetical protein
MIAWLGWLQADARRVDPDDALAHLEDFLAGGAEDEADEADEELTEEEQIERRGRMLWRKLQATFPREDAHDDDRPAERDSGT